MSYSRISKTDSCWRCGAAPFADGARFCTKCGATLTNSIYCADLPKPVGSRPVQAVETGLAQPAENRFEPGAQDRTSRPLPGFRAVFRVYTLRWIAAALSLITRHSRVLTDYRAMFWKIQYGRSLAMEDSNGSALRYLIVNRAEVVSEGCSACGQGFASDPPGERALGATVGPNNAMYMFCAGCGEGIMGHLEAEAVRQRYVWDWTVPLRGKSLNNNDRH